MKKDMKLKIAYTQNRIDLYNRIISNNQFKLGMSNIENGISSFYDGDKCIIQIREKDFVKPTRSETYMTEYTDEDSGHNIISGATQISNFKGVIGYNAFEMDTYDDKISFLTAGDSQQEFVNMFNETMDIMKSVSAQDSVEDFVK